jgi:chitinase
LWSETTTYVGGENVCWKERVYLAQWWTLGEEPGTPAGTGVGKPWLDKGPYRKG